MGGAALAERLLTLGHRRFGLVTSPYPIGIPVRRRAFLAALPIEAEVVWEFSTPVDEAITEEICLALAKRNVTAIVCSNDIVAINVLGGLRKMSIAVPNEVSVVGYDDITWARIVTPTLTTMRQPFSEAAKRALDLLVDRMANPARRARHVMLDVCLVERESTGIAPIDN